MKTNYYFFVDDDGTENTSNLPPQRASNALFWVVVDKDTLQIKNDAITELPKGTIYKLFGKHLTFEDNPIKL